MLDKLARHFRQGTLGEAVKRKASEYRWRLSGKRPPIGDAYYGGRAGTYVREREQTPLYHAEYEAIRLLLKEVPDEARVLDVPFGTGRFVPLYLEKRLHVTGLDASSDMLDAAREALGNQIESCELHVGDATKLPFADRTFDLVLCIRFLGAIVSFSKAQAALNELGRVAKGHAIISFNERKAGSRRWRRPKDSETMGGRLYADEIESLLRTAGFRVVRKEGPLSETSSRQVYMYLCESTHRP